MELSDNNLIVILPDVPLITDSLNVMVPVKFVATSVAPLTGKNEEAVGGVKSGPL